MVDLKQWWQSGCAACLAIRQALWMIGQIFFSLLSISLVLFFGLGIYWLFFDNDPIVRYGTNAIAEFSGDNIIFHLDATRMRDCPAVVTRKIGGCGQIDVPSTIVVTPVGEKPGPVSIPIKLLTQSYPKEILSGNVCYLVSTVTGYCNPAQKLFNVPIITQSPPIQFVPVARIKSTPKEEMP